MQPTNSAGKVDFYLTSPRRPAKVISVLGTTGITDANATTRRVTVPKRRTKGRKRYYLVAECTSPQGAATHVVCKIRLRHARSVRYKGPVPRIDWSSGTWLHEPTSHEVSDGRLIITTDDQSDFWRITGYGFTHYSGHALLTELSPNSAMEVEFSADWTQEFDQAGLLLHADEAHWVKAGVEFADDVLSLGAVVTDERSDWSVGHVPAWMGKPIRVRVSRTTDAIAVRARVDDQPWRLVRLAPIDPRLTWFAGPLAASPSRAGHVVTFHRWEMIEPDTSIH